MDKHNPNKSELFPNAAHSLDLPCSLSLKLWVIQNLDVAMCLRNGAAMEKAELPVTDLALSLSGEEIFGLSVINPGEKCFLC